MPEFKPDTYHGLLRTFSSPNEQDSNGEEANVVDGLFFIGRALFAVARALGDLQPKYEGDVAGAIRDGFHELAAATEDPIFALAHAQEAEDEA